MKRYTIRPLGETSWAETDDLDEARKLRAECIDRTGRHNVVIVDETTGEIVE